MRILRVPVERVARVERDMQVPAKKGRMLTLFKKENPFLFWDCVGVYAAIAKRCERYGDLFMHATTGAHEAYRREYERQGKRLPFVPEGTLEDALGISCAMPARGVIDLESALAQAGIAAVRYCLRHGVHPQGQEPLRIAEHHKVYNEGQGTPSYREMERSR